jgi:hypothetical protein
MATDLMSGMSINVQVPTAYRYLQLQDHIQQQYGPFFFIGMSIQQVTRVLDETEPDALGIKHLRFTIQLERDRSVTLPVWNGQPTPHRVVYDLLDDATALLGRKAHDYSVEEDVHSNFKHAEYVGALFPEPYKPYAVLIGIKLARLGVLLHGKVPQNESIRDTILDLVNYCALLGERITLDSQEGE